MSSQEFTLLPMVLPRDAPQILQMHYRAHLADPAHAQNPISEEEFFGTRKPQILSRFNNPGTLLGKMVLANDHEKMVSYIVFSPPKPADERTDEEKDRDLRAFIGSFPTISDKELVFSLKREDRVLNDRFFGKGYESRFWELTALMTDPAYQRRGLGSQLVQWGLQHVGGEARKSRKSEERVEGCYLIASPQGKKTYLKAGFEMVGQRGAREGLEDRYKNYWFVKRFERFW